MDSYQLLLRTNVSFFTGDPYACGPPPQIPHAVVIDQVYKEFFKLDSVVHYRCEDGYTMVESSHNNTICDYGNWTTGPTCSELWTVATHMHPYTHTHTHTPPLLQVQPAVWLISSGRLEECKSPATFLRARCDCHESRLRCLRLCHGGVLPCRKWPSGDVWTPEMVFTNRILTIQKSLQESWKSNDLVQLWWNFVDTLASVSRPPSRSEVLCVQWESGPARTGPDQFFLPPLCHPQPAWPFSILVPLAPAILCEVWRQEPGTHTSRSDTNNHIRLTCIAFPPLFRCCSELQRSAFTRRHAYMHWAAATGLARLNVCVYMTKW